MNQVRELRESRGWSQGEVARMLQISKSYVSKIENHKPKVSCEIAQRIANLFNLTVEEIFFVHYSEQ